MKETPKHPMTLRLTNDTMLVLAWAAGACASMHSVPLSTQVSYTHNIIMAASAALVREESFLTLVGFVQ